MKQITRQPTQEMQHGQDPFALLLHRFVRRLAIATLIACFIAVVFPTHSISDVESRVELDHLSSPAIVSSNSGSRFALKNSEINLALSEEHFPEEALAQHARDMRQLEVCRLYMTGHAHKTLGQLMTQAIDSADWVEITDVSSQREIHNLSNIVEKLRFADIAEMCVRLAKKVIGEEKTNRVLAAGVTG